jgi:hypothetical protein
LKRNTLPSVPSHQGRGSGHLRGLAIYFTLQPCDKPTPTPLPRGEFRRPVPLSGLPLQGIATVPASQCAGPAEIRKRAGPVALIEIRAPAVVVSRGRIRVELDSAVKIPHGRIHKAPPVVDDPAVVICPGIPRFDRNRPRKIGERPIIASFHPVGPAPVAVSSEEIRLQGDGSIIVTDGTVILPRAAVDNAPVVIGEIGA